MPTVTLLERPGCHLCEDALAELEAVRAHHPFALERRNIEEDDALLKAHLERIPVVLLEDEELFHYFVDTPELVRRLDTLDSQ